MRENKDLAKVNQWIKNLMVAQALVQDIPDEKWVPELGTWSMVCEDPNEVLRKRFHEMENCDHTATVDQLLNTCGSAACFGGWVAVTPYFTKQGVKRDSEGAPFMGDYMFDGSFVANYNRSYEGPSGVGRKLFGSLGMFDAYSTGSDVGVATTPKKEAMRRVEMALEARLREQAALEEDPHLLLEDYFAKEYGSGYHTVEPGYYAETA